MAPAESVSVIVPVLNGARFIDSCYRTLARQTLPPKEVIFVNDGSTDDSLSCIARLPAGAFAVRTITQEQVGPARARNRGLAEASGDVLAFLDVDDEWSPRCIAEWTVAFAHRPQLDVVGGLVQLDWGDDVTPRDPRLTQPHRRVNLGAYAFRRRVFQAIGEFDPSLRYGEDVDFFARIKAAGLSCEYLDIALLTYRQHAGGMTHGRGVHELGIFEALRKALVRQRAANNPPDGPIE